eukprot:scaffold117568_cov66-Phaeocystis_antarctica.AAC.5
MDQALLEALLHAVGKLGRRALAGGHASRFHFRPAAPVNKGPPLEARRALIYQNPLSKVLRSTTGCNRPPRDGARCCVAAIYASPCNAHIITCPPGFGARTFQPARACKRGVKQSRTGGTHASVSGGQGRRWQGVGAARGTGA